MPAHYNNLEGGANVLCPGEGGFQFFIKIWKYPVWICNQQRWRHGGWSCLMKTPQRGASCGHRARANEDTQCISCIGKINVKGVNSHSRVFFSVTGEKIYTVVSFGVSQCFIYQATKSYHDLNWLAKDTKLMLCWHRIATESSWSTAGSLRVTVIILMGNYKGFPFRRLCAANCYNLWSVDFRFVSIDYNKFFCSGLTISGNIN